MIQTIFVSHLMTLEMFLKAVYNFPLHFEPANRLGTSQFFGAAGDDYADILAGERKWRSAQWSPHDTDAAN
jgi:hypothetical protein